MVDDVLNLLRKQARIDRVRDRAHAGNGVIGFEVPVCVPGHGRHALARYNTQADQRLGQFLRADLGLPPIVAVYPLIQRAGDDFRVAMIARGMGYQGGNQERLVHHVTEHGAWILAVVGQKFVPLMPCH